MISSHLLISILLFASSSILRIPKSDSTSPANAALSSHEFHTAEPFISDFGKSIRYTWGAVRALHRGVDLARRELFRGEIDERQPAWREVIALAARHGIPCLAMGDSLGYFDMLRRDRVPANLIQAQRDYFGAHTYQRIDREGVFHTEWIG